MRVIENDYQLENKDRRMTPEEIRRSLEDFEYFMSNFQQITNKRRQVVPFKLNAFQKKLFETVLPLVRKETRLDRRHTVVTVKSRQVGASVSTTALVNYICAYVSGLERLNIAHIFPVRDTLSNFYNKKVKPIITGVHPDLYPYIERENQSGGISIHYRDIKGNLRDCYYDLISSNASSIRSATFQVVLEDEVCYYTNPQELENTIYPAIPDTGFSLVMYLSTVGEKQSQFFIDKLQTAIDNPEDYTIVFVPWYFTYPEEAWGTDFKSLELNEYESEVILPAMKRDGIPEDRWGDCIDWYRRRKASGVNMKLEYPTVLSEVMTLNKNESYWDKELLDKQDANILPDNRYRLVVDSTSKQPELQPSDGDAICMYKPPVAGHHYRLTVDAIGAKSESSDFFAMSMWDEQNNEQVLTFKDRGLDMRDYADIAVQLCKIYNRAMIVPEKNMAEAFIALVMESFRYYNFFYATAADKKNRTPGIRTTATTKDGMLQAVTTLLENNHIIIHSKETLDQMRNYVRKVKHHSDGTTTVRVEAAGNAHDDEVTTVFIFAGSLDRRQLAGSSSIDFLIL